MSLFRDQHVNCPNWTGYEVMCSSGIRVEHCLCSIRRPIEGLMRSGKDWALILQSYPILSLESFDEALKSVFQIRIICRPLCVQCFGFQIQS